jgi:hypothetical protein
MIKDARKDARRKGRRRFPERAIPVDKTSAQMTVEARGVTARARLFQGDPARSQVLRKFGTRAPAGVRQTANVPDSAVPAGNLQPPLGDLPRLLVLPGQEASAAAAMT